MTLLAIEPSPLAGPAESATAETLQPASDIPGNPAIERCMKAWNRNFSLASIDPRHESLAHHLTLDHFDETSEVENFAREQATNAFRDALPILAGYENIRDFIACVAYAMVMQIISREEGRELLGAAKIAMALLRTQART